MSWTDSTSASLWRLLFWYDVFFALSSTAGQEVINKVTLESRQAGRDREEIQAEPLEEAIADAVYNNKYSKCATPYNTDQTRFLRFLTECRECTWD